MKLYCPHCGVKGVADDSYRGKTVKCPKCNQTFIAAEKEPAPGMAADEPAPVTTEDLLAGERPAALLRDEEEQASEPSAPAEEAVAAEEIPLGEEDAAEEVWEVEGVEEVEEPVPAEELPAADPAALREEGQAGEPPAAAEETPAAVDEENREEREPVLDWDEIAAEVEAKTAAAAEEEARAKEELPAGLFAEPAEEEPAWPGKAGEEETAATGEGEGGRKQEGEPPDLSETSAAAAVTPAAPEKAGMVEEGREEHFIFEDRAEPEPEQVESKPYGVIKEQCWQCGRKNRSGVPYAEKSGRLYCPACLPAEETAPVPEPPPFAGPGMPPPAEEADLPESEVQQARFTIGGILRESWEKTKGAKGPIWAGSAVMYLTIIFLAAGGAFLLPLTGYDPAAPDLGIAGDIFNFAYNALIDAVSVLFTAGLLFMGIRKVAGDPIDWKMIFTGYGDAGKIIVATILQSVMIILGFLVLVLPGIYLAVGYSMTIPLIVDRKMSPWQAMETSRKAVHKVWWRVVGLYFVMVLLFIASMVPLGIGLIWTWPMFVILAGVVYRSLFGTEI